MLFRLAGDQGVCISKMQKRGKGFAMPVDSLSTIVFLLTILKCLQVYSSSLWMPFLTELLMGVLQ